MYLFRSFFSYSQAAAFTLGCFALNAQTSEDYIPKDAVSVFSFNNISILQKVSMDELVQYDFMAELQSELFDGSTQGKTLKESGIDFNQKMNVFYGKNDDFEISGFTFGISDKNLLFTVFDDFDRVEGAIEGIEYYNNYFNHLMIRGNSALLIRVDTDQEKLSELADSIWFSRGLALPWYSEEELIYDEEGNIIDPTMIEGMQEPEEDIIIDEEVDGGQEIIVEELDEIEDGETDDLSRNYYELRDSLESELSYARLLTIVDEIYNRNISLKSTDQHFAQQLTHTSDGVFYLDNSRNFKNANEFWYFQTMFPDMYNDLKELYTGNIMLGDIWLNQASVDVKLVANYGDALGTIYEDLNSAKFDKNVLKYIPASNSGYFTYNIDLKKGYDKAFEVIMPILRQERDPRISANVLIADLMNEFVNTDALFNTYKGSMFGTFNGVKRVKTTRIEFTYDEETFEYSEKEVESEEDMPVFTLGFSTARPDIPEKILNHMARLTSQFHNMGKYWVVEDAVLNSLPLYLINRNGLFILTNDEDLAKNHADGYGSAAITAKQAKNAAKSGSVYGYLDWGAILEKLPPEMFSQRQNEILNSMRGKSGILEITSGKTTKQNTVYNMQYRFSGSYDNAGKYLLDLVNSAYILSR